MFYWACLFFRPGEWAYALIFQTLSVPPSPCVRCAWARTVMFLVSGVISTCQLRAGSVKALSSSYVL